MCIYRVSFGRVSKVNDGLGQKLILLKYTSFGFIMRKIIVMKILTTPHARNNSTKHEIRPQQLQQPQ